MSRQPLPVRLESIPPRPFFDERDRQEELSSLVQRQQFGADPRPENPTQWVVLVRRLQAFDDLLSARAPFEARLVPALLRNSDAYIPLDETWKPRGLPDRAGRVAAGEVDQTGMDEIVHLLAKPHPVGPR